MNKKILVTGGAGFLGSHVLAYLKDRGYSSIFVPRSRDYDLVQMPAVERLYETAKPDVVIHMAAQVGGIGANMANPGKYFYDNLMMGLNMIEKGRQKGVEKFLTVGTICAYPKFAPVPFKEDDLWNGYPEETNAAYGIAKKALLVMSQSYRQQYGMNAIYVLPVNLYGPGDNFDLTTSHVIPAIIRKCLEAVRQGKKEVVLWGSGRPSREFLYVKDAAEGIVLAMEKYNSSEPVNLGVGSEITIAELAKLIAEMTGFNGTFIWDTSKPDGQPRRSLDVSRAKQAFGFVAKTKLREGLMKTIEWYLSAGQ